MSEILFLLCGNIWKLNMLKMFLSGMYIILIYGFKKCLVVREFLFVIIIRIFFDKLYRMYV